MKKLSLHDLSGVEANVTGLVDTGTCLDSIARLAWQMVVDLDAIDAHAVHKARTLGLARHISTRWVILRVKVLFRRDTRGRLQCESGYMTEMPG